MQLPRLGHDCILSIRPLTILPLNAVVLSYWQCSETTPCKITYSQQLQNWLCEMLRLYPTNSLHMESQC